jgi:putative transcriptional regulator
MNYTGKLLASQPTTQSDFFKESVILIVDHSEKGAWGLQINKRTDTLRVNEVVKDIGVSIDSEELCYIGGPVEQQALHLVHSSDCVMSNSIPVNDEINITSNGTMFAELQSGRGPKDWICTLGMCTWAPEQLDGEMSGQHPWTPQHRWLVTDPPKDLLNINPKLLWKQVVKSCVEEATANMW